MKTTGISQLLEAYRRGENITALLKQDSASEQATSEMIEIAYDLQTGSYIEAMQDPELAAAKQRYLDEAIGHLEGLNLGESILDAGTGETTTLTMLVHSLPAVPAEILAFDGSWSRIHFARSWMASRKLDASLFVADLMGIPLASNSVDTVFTSHAIEPNGGREKEILRELYRVASRYLVLLEPSNELGSAATGDRMKEHGYCHDLARHCSELGYSLIRHELLSNVARENNQTALHVIEKDGTAAVQKGVAYTVPGTDFPLRNEGAYFFSEDEFLMFPVFKGIPCLRRSNAVIGSKHDVSCDIKHPTEAS